MEGFDLAAVDYLLKPITFQRFYQAVERFLAAQATLPSQAIAAHKPFIFIRKDRKQVKLLLQKVRYVESWKDYVRIHLQDESYTVKHTLRDFVARLDKRFLRVHRSFVVNKDHITAYTKHDIELGNTEIPIGPQYRGILEEL
ncbi:MAG: LytTR family DNA-binding domain-containing protein [Bacteroidota bacterium]